MKTILFILIFTFCFPLFSKPNGEDIVKALMLLQTAQVWNISTEKEIKIGREYHNEIMKHYHVYKDEKKTQWAQNIFNKVASYAKRQRNGEINYTLTILDDKTINAFAIPGGFIQVFSGLLNKITSDDELACILGHEITHVEKKHSLKQMKSSAMLSTLVLMGTKSGDARSGLNAIKNLTMLSYSRKDEEEADDGGTKLAAKAGYNAYAMVNFMEKLMKLDKSSAAPWKEIFMTHPLSNIRAQTLIWKIQDGKFDYNTDKPIFLSFAVSREVSFTGCDILRIDFTKNKNFSCDGMNKKGKTIINFRKKFNFFSSIVPIKNDHDYILSILFDPKISLSLNFKIKFFDANRSRIFPDFNHEIRVLNFRQLQEFKVHAYTDIPKNARFCQLILSSDSEKNTFAIEKIALFDKGFVEKRRFTEFIQTPGFKIEGLDKLGE